jgi:CubicO group peptidase (beta-lactamase class C family)
MNDFGARLTDSARRFGIRQIAGALIANGETQFSEIASIQQIRFDCDTPQPIFCLAKVLTASLIALAVQDDLLAMDARVEEVFACAPMEDFDGHARRVTVFHLLGHMHGWQNASTPAHRRDESGFITPQAILRDLTGQPRLYEPGAMYSYDAVGYLLLGAMLERIHHARFSDILRRHLFPRLAMTGADAAADACPAGDGAGILLSVRDLSRFVAFHLLGGPQAASRLAPRVIDTPGWSPFYQGTSLAWRHLGGDWLSHEGVGFQGAPYSMVRLNPAENIALVLISPDPRSRGAALTAFDATPLLGVYVNGDSCTTIYKEGGRLRGRFAIGGSTARQERTLQPATRDVLFLNAPVGRRHFIQPLHANGTSEITHLWDGYEVARRTTP